MLDLIELPAPTKVTVLDWSPSPRARLDRAAAACAMGQPALLATGAAPMTDLPPDAAPAADPLVERAVDGDSEALSRLLALVGPRVRAGLRIGSTWRAAIDADDVMQTTYLEVFLRVSRLESRTEAGFSRWITRIAENNLRDAIRSLDRDKRPDRRRQMAPRSHEDSCTELIAKLGHVSHTASRDALARESVALLHEALGRLPQSYRTVVERCDLQGRRVTDVAAAMERSAGAVHMLRARAHDRLRELIGPQTRIFTRPAPPRGDDPDAMAPGATGPGRSP
jgi:RNA polymerase sigma factor (sigma-70 family)